MAGFTIRLDLRRAYSLAVLVRQAMHFTVRKRLFAFALLKQITFKHLSLRGDTEVAKMHAHEYVSRM